MILNINRCYVQFYFVLDDRCGELDFWEIKGKNGVGSRV